MSSNGLLTEDELIKDELIADEIQDDTNLLQRFQTVDRTDPRAISAFANDVDNVDNVEEPKYEAYRNPWIKIALAVGAGAFVLAFLSLFALNNSGEQTVETTNEEADQSLTLSLEEPGPSDINGDDGPEVQALKSELALLEQQLALAQVERDRIPQEGIEQQRTTASRTAARPTQTNGTQISGTQTNRSATPSAQRPAPAVRTSNPTAVAVRAPTPARPAPRPAPARTPARLPARTSVAASSPSQPVSRPPAAPVALPQPAVDPNEAWITASGAGVFGIMPPAGQALETQPIASSFEPAPYQLQSVAYNRYEDIELESSQTLGQIPGLIYQGEAPIPLGTAAKGRVVTPISWIESGRQFLIQLEEDLLDAADRVAVPAGALAIVQPVSVESDSGYARLAVVGFSIDDQLIPIDYQTVSINGPAGDLLIAQRYGDIGSEIAANDFEQFAIGALGGIGEVLTRPDSQTLSTGTLGSVVSTRNGAPSILGGILQGGTEQLSERMAERNDERLGELRERADIFYLPKDFEVQLYVNQEFIL
ncbi:MAG: hypothetical protein WA901_05545 [Phormidesmis sp.]